jgi:subtilisin family serine protease
MNILATMLLVLTFSFSALAEETTFLEEPVRDFMQSPQGGASKLSVLLIFSSEKKLPFAMKQNANLLKQFKLENAQTISELKNTYIWTLKLQIEPLWILNGAFVDLTKDQILELAKNPKVIGIYAKNKKYKMKQMENSFRSTSADYTYGLKKIGVPELRKNFPNFSGKGVRVGVLDTGIAITHRDLKGKLRAYKNFSPANELEPRDDFGHGTHVAGTIVGGNFSGQEIGVAPEAELIVGRIFDGNGESTRELILKSMQWMADPDENPETEDFAQVINSSWSDDEPYADRDWDSEPFCKIIDSWVSLNMIPVFSAGNTGPSAGTINLPAGCPNAFSVGATEYNDRSPHFSSTGPAVWKSVSLMKPEISAPGFHVKSANKYGGYEEMSGTSMAAPHVTGAFAILLQAHPKANAEQIKNAMLAGAKDLGAPSQDAIFGWGRVDIIKSLEKLSSF